jgi:hypothetical protein
MATSSSNDSNGGTKNPSYPQRSGSWTSAQATKVPVINRPSDVDSLRNLVILNSGGALGKPDPGKIQKVKNTLDERVFTKLTVMPDKTDLKLYSWNLPPHTWSLPLEPSTFDNMIADSQAWDKKSNPVNRRGRIYWYSRVDANWMDSKTKNVGKNSDPRYGFHFLWNPETFSTGVSVNMDITPTTNDKFVQAVGAFPSGEALTLSLQIDRTNDMYCLRSHDTSRASLVSSFDTFYPFYKGNSFEDFTAKDPVSKGLFEDKIKELQTLGTIADIEYLYKAINGPDWTNPASGRKTADIGFLSPTLLKIEIGPLSYIGYISNISVTHTAFTKGMIPIRSDVSMQFNLMATAGMASGGTAVSQ